jgi:hypothetical protein
LITEVVEIGNEIGLYLYALKYGVAPLVTIEVISVLIGVTAGLIFKLKPRDVALLCLAFGAIGAITGLFMGASRHSVVGTVVPAFLTLVSGLAAYQFAAKGSVYETWRNSLPVAIACMFLAASSRSNLWLSHAEPTGRGIKALRGMETSIRTGGASDRSRTVAPKAWASYSNKLR